MISSKLRYVVGSPSPLKAMSFSRRSGCGRAAELLGLDRARRRSPAPASCSSSASKASSSTNRVSLWPRAIDLAVDAIEVADLVRVEIHAQGDSARTPAEHRVDEPVLLKPPRMIPVQR